MAISTVPKGHPVRLRNRVSLSLAVLSALTLAGCGKNEAQDVARAKAELARKDVNTARIELKKLIQTHPKSGEARYLLGAQLLADGEGAAAVIELQRALEFKYNEALVLPRLAEAQILAGQARQVIAQYTDTRLADADAQARLQASVAYALALEGDTARAGDAVQRALAASPKSAHALLMKARLAAVANDVDGGLQTLDELLAAHPDSHEGWSLKGDLLLRKADGQAAAMAAFRKALEAKPDQLYAHSALVALNLSRGDLDGAKKQFALLQKLAPKHPNTALFDAHLAYASGNHARAREILQALLRALPENVNVLLSAGENEMKLGAVQQAEAQFAKASALAPRNALARRLLAQAQMRLGQAPKALLTLAPLVDAADASADVLTLAAQARLLNGEAKAADALYTRVAKLKPTDPRLRTIVATAALGKDNDNAVFSELRDIAGVDAGTSADMALISAHLRRGQVDAALQALNGLTRKRPNDPMSHQLLGQILVMKKDNAGARKAFEQALVADAGYFPAVAALAALDLQDQQPDNARQRFKALLKAQPGNARILLAMAELSQRQGAPRAEVLKQLDAAVKAAPSDPDARAALIAYHFGGNQFDAALAAAQAATVALPENLELLELLGRCQIRVRQPSQALATYGKIANVYPKSPRGHLGMADVYLSTNELDLAQRSISRALELAPNLPEAQGQAVVVALRRRQHDAALAIARSMQTQRPADTDGLMLEGEIEMNRGRWDAAAAALRQAMAKSGSGTAALKLHHVLLRAGKGAEADALAQRWLQAHPDDAAFLFYLGDAAQTKGDAATAERHYQQVLKAQPEHVLALNNLAMLYLQQKKPGATALAERAVKGAPDQAALLDTLAQAQAADGQVSQAVDTQKRAVAMAPGEPTLQLRLARYHLQGGDKAQAKAELDKLAKLGTAFAQQAEVTQLRSTLTVALPGR